MNNKKVILTIGLFLLMGFLGALPYQFGFAEEQDIITGLAGIVGRFAAIGIILYHGTLVKSKLLFSIASFFVGCLVVGTMAVIMHWSYSHLVTMIGLVGLPVTYGIHFFRKEEIYLLDNLKFVCLIFFSIASVAIMMNFSFKNKLHVFADFLLLAMYADFIYLKYIRDPF